MAVKYYSTSYQNRKMDSRKDWTIVSLGDTYLLDSTGSLEENTCSGKWLEIRFDMHSPNM